jgi:epoxyqueuosine reductase
MRTSTFETGHSVSASQTAIRDKALEEGFDVVGFADANITDTSGERLAKFIEHGAHGDMDWLASRVTVRQNPIHLWSDVKTVISVGVNYGPADDPMAVLDKTSNGAISVYARGDDYHDIMKKRLKALARWVSKTLETEVKVFVDTAPVLEKPIAAAAGLGWQGKHTNVVSREFGSWLFLGEIFVALEMPVDAAHADNCGSCQRCLTACPTDAFPAPYQLDARRCISYLTIEHKGHIDRSLRPLIGNRIYGCDDCLAVCPWNRFAQISRNVQLGARAALTAPSLESLARLDDKAFRALFRKSPIKRTGRARFVRNVLIAIGNSGDVELLPCVVERLADESPLVRAMAVWAMARLADRPTYEQLAHQQHNEPDVGVQEEWNMGFPS